MENPPLDYATLNFGKNFSLKSDKYDEELAAAFDINMTAHQPGSKYDPVPKSSVIVRYE
jgi:hypothetical protein